MLTVKECKEYVKENGGISVNKCKELVNYDCGFIVSIEQYTYTTKSIDDAITTLLEYVNDLPMFDDEIKSNKSIKGACAGVWFSDGVYYVDINLIYKLKIQAIRKGIREKQKGIYSIKDDKTISLEDEIFTSYAIYKKLYKIIIDDKTKKEKKILVDERFLKVVDDYVVANYYMHDKENYTIETIKMSIKEYHEGL